MSASPQEGRVDLTAPPPLLTRDDVARYVGLPLREVLWWVWALREDRRYYEFEVERRSGAAPRTISAPIKPLKDIQRALLPLFNAGYAPKPHVHGFVTGRGPMTNAKVHCGQRWLLKIDLKDFFPTVNFGRVRGVLLAHPFDYPPDVATLIAAICCHRNALPQGALNRPGNVGGPIL